VPGSSLTTGGFGDLETMHNEAPAWARAVAHARPIPRVAPVMRTFLPLREKRDGEGIFGVGSDIARTVKRLKAIAPNSCST